MTQRVAEPSVRCERCWLPTERFSCVRYAAALGLANHGMALGRVLQTGGVKVAVEEVETAVVQKAVEVLQAFAHYISAHLHAQRMAWDRRLEMLRRQTRTTCIQTYPRFRLGDRVH